MTPTPLPTQSACTFPVRGGYPSATRLPPAWPISTADALARGLPAAQDDQRYGFGLAAACLSWALVRLHRFALSRTRVLG